MHVLQLVPTLNVGGVERGVLDLAKGLVARGHQVSVVSAGGPLVERLTQLGARHYELPVHEKSPLAVARCLPALTQLIRTSGVDIVHARSRIPAWVGFIASRRAQRPFVTTAHGFYTPHLASRVMGWGRLVIVPSEALAGYLMEHFGLPRERLRLIPRGVDLDEFLFQPPAPHQGPWRIGLFGRLSAIKGHEVALRAAAQLRRQGLDVRLCVVGDTPGAPARHRLDAMASELQLGDAVEWLGVRQDVATLLASMDLVAVPSTYPESFGRVVIEAQAVGRPVVASRIGALADVIQDGETGLLVPPGDAHALAEALGRFITDAGLRERCIQVARARAESAHSLHQMVEQTLAVYDECLTQPRILVWKLGALGDVILSTPSLRAIRRQYPRAQIALIVGRTAYEAVARCPYLNECLIYDRAGKDRGLNNHVRLIRRIRRAGFDVSIDFQNSRRTHLMAWAAGIPVRVGYRRKYGWLLNRGVRLPRVVLAPIAHQRYVLRKAGFSDDGDALEVWPSPLDAQKAEQLLGPACLPGAGAGRPAGAGEPRQLVGLHPGGSGRWKTKRWELARWARLGEALLQRDIRVVITGGPEEQALGQALMSLMASQPILAVGQTSVMELACVIQRCDVFVAHDSSPLHLAAAVGTPTVALFGPTEPGRHLAPSFVGQVIKKDVFCSPCYSTRCRTITHACMQRISLDEVLSAVLGLLAEAERAPALERAPG